MRTKPVAGLSLLIVVLIAWVTPEQNVVSYPLPAAASAIVPWGDSSVSPRLELRRLRGHAKAGSFMQSEGSTAHPRTLPDTTDASYTAQAVRVGAVKLRAWVSGYYVGYEADHYPPSAIAWSSLSHLMLGSVAPRADGAILTRFDRFTSDAEGLDWAKGIVASAHAHDVKLVLMIGGAGEIDGWRGATIPQRRGVFVANIVKLVLDSGADGVDIDWEPVETLADRTNLREFSRALRAALPGGKLMTIPMAWGNANLPETWDPYLATLAPFYDQLNIMSYDMASASWGFKTWHSSAIYQYTTAHDPHPELMPTSIDTNVKRYAAIGIPKAKLGIGLGFYGSCWRGVLKPGDDPNAAFRVVGENGQVLPVMGDSDNLQNMSDWMIRKRYFSNARVHWDEVARVPYLASNTPFGPQRCTFVSYENERSIAEKAAYVRVKGLGGTIIWTINQGYLPEVGRNPLLTAVGDAFLR